MKTEMAKALKRKATRIIAVLEVIGRGEQAIVEGRVMTHKQARRRMSRRLSALVKG